MENSSLTISLPKAMKKFCARVKPALAPRASTFVPSSVRTRKEARGPNSKRLFEEDCAESLSRDWTRKAGAPLRTCSYSVRLKCRGRAASQRVIHAVAERGLERYQ
jgi:hypothetical protein